MSKKKILRFHPFRTRPQEHRISPSDISVSSSISVATIDPTLRGDRNVRGESARQSSGRHPKKTMTVRRSRKSATAWSLTRCSARQRSSFVASERQLAQMTEPGLHGAFLRLECPSLKAGQGALPIRYARRRGLPSDSPSDSSYPTPGRTPSQAIAGCLGLEYHSASELKSWWPHSA